VRGFTQRAGGGADWSDDIIDVAPLGLADGDLALSADRLIYKDVKTGPVRLSLQLKDSAARLTLEDMLLYDGRGRGVVTLDGRGQAPATTVNLMLEGTPPSRCQGRVTSRARRQAPSPLRWRGRACRSGRS
jgi:AsmA protein